MRGKNEVYYKSNLVVCLHRFVESLPLSSSNCPHPDLLITSVRPGRSQCAVSCCLLLFVVPRWVDESGKEEDVKAKKEQMWIKNA